LPCSRARETAAEDSAARGSSSDQEGRGVEQARVLRTLSKSWAISNEAKYGCTRRRRGGAARGMARSSPPTSPPQPIQKTNPVRGVPQIGFDDGRPSEADQRDWSIAVRFVGPNTSPSAPTHDDQSLASRESVRQLRRPTLEKALVLSLCVSLGAQLAASDGRHCECFRLL
jgi:hypothetical protein